MSACRTFMKETMSYSWVVLPRYRHIGSTSWINKREPAGRGKAYVESLNLRQTLGPSILDNPTVSRRIERRWIRRRTPATTG